MAGIPRRLWKAQIEVAIGLHDEPFYGHSSALLVYTCGGEASKGTTRFFRLATAYVIFKDMRLTLALFIASRLYRLRPGRLRPGLQLAINVQNLRCDKPTL